MKKNVRKQGILLPISSIPSTYGIGTFGKESYRFVDFLEKSGNHLWQILPLGPTGYGDSPYQSFSTFAGNPYYIDLELLIEDGYLTKEICDSYDFGDNEHYVDYEKIYLSRFKVLKIAFDNAREQGLTETGDYQKFLTENAYWLDDYALYMAVKNAFGGVCFMEWDEDIRLRKAAALRKYRKKLAEEIAFYCFQQYLFAKQWKELKAYANKKGIEIVGDIPIYVAFDSADTWANPKLFQLDKEGRPIGVAGCPPVSPRPDSYGATRSTTGVIIRRSVMRGGCSGSPIAISCMMCFVLIISAALMNTGSFLTEIRRRRTAIGKKAPVTNYSMS